MKKKTEKRPVPPYVIGIDSGTVSLRTGIFNIEGTPIAFATKEYPVFHLRPGWAEQESNDWWEAAILTTKECLSESKVNPEDIIGISVDGTSCTVVPVKENGEALRRALLWMDVRAHEQAERVTKTNHKVLKYVGNQESPEWMIPKAMWLKENEPEVFKKADKIIESTDYLMFRLTGKWTASRCNATCKWNYTTIEGGYPLSLLEQLGIPELVSKWPPEVIPMGEKVGELIPDAAKELNLIPGIPIAEGGIDAYAGMIGLKVVKPEELGLILGSSTCHMAVSPVPVYGTGVWGPYPDAIIGGSWILEGGQVSTGSIIKWFRDNFAHEELIEAKEKGIDSYKILDSMADKIKPGSEGLIFLDYFQGNRSPWRDPLARGVLWGMSLKHTKAHIFRAIMEGTAYGTRHIIENLAKGGLKIKSISACGGGAKSKLWLQIHADVLNIPVYLTEVSEATTLGAAICAAVAGGAYKTLSVAAERMVRITRRIEPLKENHEIYTFYFNKYCETYPRLKDLMHEVTRKVE